jgi:hypothetical protein
VASIPLEIGFPSYEILCFDIRKFSFSLSYSNFSMCLSFLEDFLSQFRRFPVFKEKNWLPTQEGTTNNSNSKWTNLSSYYKIRHN